MPEFTVMEQLTFFAKLNGIDDDQTERFAEEYAKEF